MNDPEAIVAGFYQAFEHLDAEKMASYYLQDSSFHDPAFGSLNGTQAQDMWRMLIKRSRDLKVEFGIESSDGNTVITNWKATYTFGSTGRRVHNKVRSTIEVREQKISNHRDEFNLYTWSRQALGLTGFLIGWTQFFRKNLQGKTNKMLAKFQETKRE